MATYNLISSQTLASSAASVAFSSIPQTYTDLVLKWSARDSTATVTDTNLSFQVNGVTTGYSFTTLLGNGSSAASVGYAFRSQIFRIAIPAAGATSNTFNNGELYIPNYAGSATKVLSVQNQTETNGTTFAIGGGIIAGLTNATSAITSITLFGNGNLVQYSSFYLYGISNS